MPDGGLLLVAAAMAGAVPGAVLGWLLAARRQAAAVRDAQAAAAEAARAPLEALAGQLRVQLDELRSREAVARDEVRQLGEAVRQREVELAGLRERLDAASRHHEENIARLQGMVAEADKRLADQFKAVAAQILDEKTAKFTETNRARLDELLQPFRERLQEFQKKVEDTHLAEMQGQSQLKGELDRLMRLNQQVSEEAHNLTTALKGDAKARGNWGELILERALELSGLEAGREYRLQDSRTTDEGERRQPDVVITLPDNRCLIIDSKVSLVAYERHANADNDDDRDAALRDHLASVRAHMKSLGDKDYPQLYGVASVDFVLLFVPLEPALLLALRADAGLYEEALRRNVVLVGPSSLLATLRVVTQVWRLERQNRNVEEIAKIGGLLYDSFVNFAVELEKVQKAIGGAGTSVDEALRLLRTGGTSLTRRAEKLRELGVKSKKQRPASLAGDDGDEDAAGTDGPRDLPAPGDQVPRH
jgi:DNA recombination protein RmuC